jgi:hypothetical protein
LAIIARRAARTSASVPARFLTGMVVNLSRASSASIRKSPQFRKKWWLLRPLAKKTRWRA